MKQKPKLGQNFLTDDQARHRIADALGDLSTRTVVEIGPGHGAITEILAPRCRRLIAIELDAALAAGLRFRLRDHPQVEIHQGDILKSDLKVLIGPESSADCIGNLPYYITSDILLHLFQAARDGVLNRAVLMMQREVAQRLAARPGTSDYGLLSATAQLHAQVEDLFTLPPSAFSPPPEVYSTVLRLQFAPRFAELRIDQPGFNTFLKQSFAQKRKTLHNNLRTAGYTPEQIRQAWPPSLPADARAETLLLEQAATLYRQLTAPAELPKV